MTLSRTDELTAPHQKALALAEVLESLLEREFDLLRRQDLDAFDVTQTEKNDLLAELSALSGIEPGQPHAADALGAEWDAFKDRMRHCRHLHRRNEVLILRKMDAIRGALQSLRIQDPSSSVEVYDRLGRVSRFKQNRGYSPA